MADNPQSRGIGTGAAQVYDYSRIDNAMNNAMNVVNRKKERQADKEDAEQKEKDLALKKLRSDFKYDTSKIKDVDRAVVEEKVKNLNASMDGNWESVLNGDPKYSNMYRELTSEIKNYIADSADAKKEELALYNKAKEPNSGYSAEAVKNLENLWTTPGITPSMLREQGAYNRDTIIGNIFGKVDDAFHNENTALYKEIDTSYTDSKGGYNKQSGKKWLPDEEALPKFKKTVLGTPEIMQDMNIKYGELPEEERFEAFYNDYKTSRIDEQMSKSSGAAQERDSGGDSDSGGKWNLSSVYDEKKGKNVVSIASSGSTGKPYMMYGGTFRSPDGKMVEGDAYIKNIWVDNGKIYGTVSGTLNVGDGTSSKEESVNNQEVQLSKVDFNQLAAGLGINETYESFIGKVKRRAKIKYKKDDKGASTGGAY